MIQDSIAHHVPGISLIAKLRELSESDTRKLGSLARIFGTDPLPREAASWAKGLIGERQVGGALDRLRDEGYHVLHSVPIGRRGADIDHIVVSPTGAVFIINTKYHPGARIWIGPATFMVNGHRVPYFRNSLSEGHRVDDRISANLGRQVRELVPVIVVTGHSAIKHDIASHNVVRVVDTRGLIKLLRRPEYRDVSRSRVDDFDRDVMSTASFWVGTDWAPFDQDALLTWYAELDSRRRGARAVRTVWRLVGALALISVALSIPALTSAVLRHLT